MKPQKRLESTSSLKEIFQIPKILYLPGFFLSIAITILSFFVQPFSVGYFIGGIFAALLFFILIFVSMVIPAARGGMLKRDGINSTAVVIKKEQRQRWLSTLDPSNRIQVPTTVITFEFTPEGAKLPLQLEAEVQRVTASMQVGKNMKITYARANPRIVKLPGE